MSGYEMPFVLRRILKIEPKNRERTYTYIEKELLTAIDYSGLNFADTVNNSLYYYLHDVKKIDPEDIANKLNIHIR